MPVIPPDQDPYRAPQASPIAVDARASPRRRFWLACMGGFLIGFAITALLVVSPARVMDTMYVPVVIGICVALVALWLLSMTWVVQSHWMLPGIRLGVVWMMLISLGLTLALMVSLAAGAWVAAESLSWSHTIDVDLPQRRM